MNYAKINATDIANGIGVRVSLFVSGCNRRCKGCFNPETWDYDYGKEFTVDTLYELKDLVSKDYISGLTILGGEPLDPENRHMVTLICCWIKRHVPNKTIWIYTGYTYEKVKHLDVLNYVDVLVDGAYIEELKDISLPFRGSSNQRIIDVARSKYRDSVVEVEL